MAFIDHKDRLNISIDVKKYRSSDSSKINIRATDESGRPVAGVFSVALNNSSRIKTDSLGENLVTRSLLTAELSGYVEDPGRYFSRVNEEVWKELDDLLITQGWSCYKEIPEAFNHRKETGLMISGTVLDQSNKPIPGAKVTLWSKSPSILRDTISDNLGRFVFEGFPKIDTPVFILKATGNEGKNLEFLIKMDEDKQLGQPLRVGPEKYQRPWNVNPDTIFAKFTGTKAEQIAAEEMAATTRQLKEVKISSKRIVQGSKNLNGPGNADIVLNEKSLEKEKQGGLFDLWVEKLQIVPGTQGYQIDGRVPIIFIDGIDLFKVMPFQGNSMSEILLDIKGYLNSFRVKDIKGIELSTSLLYTSTYRSRYPEYFGVPTGKQFIFLDITTRSGVGPGAVHKDGVFVYKPERLTWYRSSYKPLYVPTGAHATDLRTTVMWLPEVMTDNNGNASFNFSHDKDSRYQLIIEGTDLEGHLGYLSVPVNNNLNRKSGKD
ncbi:carboxypeptidase-like regulatory domain-containing protein [Mucilaginibacter pedocola]|uniref:Carboxypeptidase regulatory-like domain-containing protein n=1 Tax=Mucilaginibacter pedocola TaxID=1792845 RepID=A0A1S9PH99_9SPHI|nr:carboxypeptidase-like regulatory domain-containing protein [Mucilaginibacter pedocola]OOQ60340.1 hypothetical protein BC343_25275 [Mucilaginibacter pedocola]